MDLGREPVTGGTATRRSRWLSRGAFFLFAVPYFSWVAVAVLGIGRVPWMICRGTNMFLPFLPTCSVYPALLAGVAGFAAVGSLRRLTASRLRLFRFALLLLAWYMTVVLIIMPGLSVAGNLFGLMLEGGGTPSHHSSAPARPLKKDIQ